jgi:WG containing repeat
MNNKFLKAIAGITLTLGTLIARNIVTAESSSADNVRTEVKTQLYPIQLKNKWGYIDKTGKIIIQPQYEFADRFTNDRAVVKSGELFGFIDRTGNIVIKPQFYATRGFSDNLAAVFDGYGWGYIDRSGKIVIKPQLYQAEDFQSGIAKVMLSDRETTAWIDANGKVIIGKNSDFDEVWGDFKEGFARIKKGNLYGFIDNRGRVSIKPQYDWAGDFQEGFAQIGVGKKYGYIDRTGKIAIAPQLLPVMTSYGNTKAPSVQAFSEGLAGVRDQKIGRWGYMNLQTKIVIKPQFIYISPFKDGLAKVKVKDSWGFVDRSGKIIVKPQFNEGDKLADNLGDGIISVKLGYLGRDRLYKWKIGYIDRQGKYIWQPSE